MTNSGRILMRCYAALALLGAALHFWWHWLLPRLPEMRGLGLAQWTLINVMNLSIGGVCLFFAAVGFWLSERADAPGPIVCFLTYGMGAFWTWRLTLEFMFPVAVPVLGPYTSPLIKGLVIIGLLLLLGVGSMGIQATGASDHTDGAA